MSDLVTLALKIFFFLSHFFRIFSFFEKIETWFKVSSVPNAMNQRIEHLKRSFNVSQLIYKEFSSLYGKLFNCSEIGDGANNEQPKTTKSRRKVK